MKKIIILCIFFMVSTSSFAQKSICYKARGAGIYGGNHEEINTLTFGVDTLLEKMECTLK